MSGRSPASGPHAESARGSLLFRRGATALHFPPGQSDAAGGCEAGRARPRAGFAARAVESENRGRKRGRAKPARARPRAQRWREAASLPHERARSASRLDHAARRIRRRALPVGPCRAPSGRRGLRPSLQPPISLAAKPAAAATLRSATLRARPTRGGGGRPRRARQYFSLAIYREFMENRHRSQPQGGIIETRRKSFA